MSSEGDVGAFYRQTDSRNGLFLELTAEHPQGRVQKVRERSLVSLKLQFDHDELVSYTEYRKTELTRKSADWINRASRALWLSTSGTISSATLSDLREKTLARYNCGRLQQTTYNIIADVTPRATRAMPTRKNTTAII